MSKLWTWMESLCLKKFFFLILKENKKKIKMKIEIEGDKNELQLIMKTDEDELYYCVSVIINNYKSIEKFMTFCKYILDEEENEEENEENIFLRLNDSFYIEYISKNGLNDHIFTPVGSYKNYILFVIE